MAFLPTGWIAYDFGAGSEKDIVQIVLQAEDVYYATASPQGFDIDYSDDGSIWYNAWSESGQTGWTVSESRTFTMP